MPKSAYRVRVQLGFCLLAMTVLVAIALWFWGWSLPAALTLGIAIGCAIAMFYAWWLSRRALRPLDDAGCTSTEQNLHNNPRRTQ